MTTHSNHLLDMTLDFSGVSVYKFIKYPTDSEPKFLVENVSNDDTSVLDLLGVQNSSVMLSNCTIWVEGITDRLYLRKYFDLYQKHHNEELTPFKEDVHFSFLEYGGGNITHWSFLMTVHNLMREVLTLKDCAHASFLWLIQTAIKRRNAKKS